MSGTVPSAPPAPAPTAPTAPPSSAPPASAPTAPSLGIIMGNISRLAEQYFVKIAPEIGHLAPIILSFGTLFMAVLSLSYPLAILSLSSVEAFAFYSVLSKMGTYIATPFSGIQSGTQSKNCVSQFQTITPSRFNLFMKNGLVREFPNSPIYFISFAAAYCIQSMYFLTDELSELGPSYSNRPYIAIISAAMFILLYTFFLLAYSCDSIFSIGISCVLGLLIGYFISSQNHALLGKDGINILFIPVLAQRSGMSYVCANVQTSASSSYNALLNAVNAASAKLTADTANYNRLVNQQNPAASATDISAAQAIVTSSTAALKTAQAELQAAITSGSAVRPF
jgi:hypothetical protein